MPNGKTHNIISLLLFPIVLIVCWLLTKNVFITTIITASYIFASFMFNGDLDTNSGPYNRWWLLKIIWIPYQIIFNHRSIFTHGIIIGTVIRIVYLSLIPAMFLLFNGNLLITLKSLNWDVIILCLIGLELGSSIHTISDKLF